MWHRVASSSETDFSKQTDQVPLDSFVVASGNVESANHDEWRVHAAPSEAILGIQAAALE